MRLNIILAHTNNPIFFNANLTVIFPDDTERSTARIVQWADSLTSSSYAVFDSGYKQMYDRYRDERNTYVPLNGDVAGCVVNTAFRAEPWFSPAGLSRGQIRNVTKLPYSPSKSQNSIAFDRREGSFYCRLI